MVDLVFLINFTLHIERTNDVGFVVVDIGDGDRNQW